MILHIASNDDAHAGSSGSVAEEEDARLERSLECRRREGKNELLLQAYAYKSLCAGDFPFVGPWAEHRGLTSIAPSIQERHYTVSSIKYGAAPVSVDNKSEFRSAAVNTGQ